MVVGLALVGTGSYVAKDLGALLTEGLADSWPYLLLVLAIALTIVTVTEARRLVGPALIAAAAGIGLLMKLDRPLLDYLPLIAIAAGIAIAMTGVGPGRPDRLVSAMWPSRWVLRDALPARIGVTSLLTAVSVDLRDTTTPKQTAIVVTAIASHVRLKVPASWPVELDHDVTPLVAVDEHGSLDSVDKDISGLRLRAGGAFGSVVVERY